MKASSSNTLTLCLILAVILQHLITTATAQGNETDHNALLAIKNRLVDHQGVLSSWNKSLNHCQWKGVTCGRKHNRVTNLKLNSTGLAGNISPYIGNLSFLRVIWLQNNILSGSIPSELGRLSRLQLLALQNNTLVDEIPRNLSSCFNLKLLNVNGNKLEGKLPISLGALTKLKFLDVGENNFNGPLFEVIANLTSLETIYATDNGFTGTIHHNVGMMQKLSSVSAADNALSGVIPNSLFNLSFLEELDFGDNLLRGEIPENIGFTLPKLRFFSLVNNSLSGTIPNSIANLTNLEVLGLDTNNFTGSMPHDFRNLKNLRTVNLGLNQLQGDINHIISSLLNSSHLEILDIGGNDVTGVLPESIGNLSTTLNWLSVGANPIKGTFPTYITNLINLNNLYIYDTKITGSLPQDFGKLHRLETVILRSNKLTGRLPDSLGNLSYLSVLELHYNNLEGNIPPSIGNCQYLLELYLHTNNLTGNLPSEIFEGSAKILKINLSENNLQGTLPSGISKQQNLIWLALGGNQFSGVIPDGLRDCSALQVLLLDGNSFNGNIPQSVTSLINLIYLDLSSNEFSGVIPSSLSSLVNLQLLDLSNNNLSGTIPSYLSRFPLQYLNLGNNQFEGRVPADGAFRNASVTSVAGNSKLCGGVSALHLPKCIKEIRLKNKRRISLAVKVIIPIVCTLAVVMALLAIVLYLYCVRNNRKPLVSDQDRLVIGKQFLKVSYDMLLKATDGFSSENFLGAGTFGTVYKGNLQGKTVAVKVLNLQKHGASKSFMAECKTLRNVRHRNLVGIVTACSTVDFQRNVFKTLVYEFMSNGSLDDWLHGTAGNLTLLQRLNIGIDVAHALKYLHHEHGSLIVHCDLKPSNVLLDKDMVAHVGDFGLTKFIAQPQDQNQSSTTGIRGTIGYSAPEYGLGSEASPEGDLYSYGILLLELMTGKRPTDSMFNADSSLHMYAEAALPDKVFQIVDSSLVDDESDEEVDFKRPKRDTTIQQKFLSIASVVRVGVACSHHMPKDRMRITDAISKLQAARDNLPVLETGKFSVMERNNQASTSLTIVEAKQYNHHPSW